MRVDTATSLDIGSVRMTERHVAHDPPSVDELAAIQTDTRDALCAAGDLGWAAGDRLIGVAGTVTTLAALAMGLDRYDSTAIHGVNLTRIELAAAVRRLVSMDRQQRSAQAVIHPGRVDIIAAGAVIVDTLLDFLDADAMTVSEHDILDGIALGLQA